MAKTWQEVYDERLMTIKNMDQAVIFGAGGEIWAPADSDVDKKELTDLEARFEKFDYENNNDRINIFGKSFLRLPYDNVSISVRSILTSLHH